MPRHPGQDDYVMQQTKSVLSAKYSIVHHDIVHEKKNQTDFTCTDEWHRD